MTRLAALLLLLLLPAVAGAQLMAWAGWPADPDLPQNVPTGALPANWDATADYTPADNAALQELLDGDTTGDATNGTANDWTIIQLTSDGTNYGPIAVDDSCEYIFIRTDAHANLPAHGSRLLSTDDSNGYLALLSRAPTNALHHALDIPIGDGGPGAQHIQFLGIKFDATGSGYAGTNYIGPVSIAYTGTPPTDFTELPTHIGFDRCLFHVDDDVDGWENNFNCTDSFVIGCRFSNFWGGGNDGSNALRTYTGGRLLINNNYMQCMGAAWFAGGNELCVVEDVEFSRNYHIRPSAWNDGLHGAHKGSIETKVGERIEIAENVFEGQYNTAGFGVVTLKAEGTGGPKACTHVTVRGNLMFDCELAIVLLVGGSSDDDDVGPNADWLIEDNLAYDIMTRGINIDPYDNTPGLPFRRVQIRNNTIMSNLLFNNYQATGTMEDGSTPGEDFVFTDNVIYGRAAVNNGNPGSEAFNWAYNSTYVATHNVFLGTTYGVGYYDDDASPAPLGTLTNNNFPVDLTGYGFTDTGANDYSISNGSDWAAASSTGGKPGYDSVTYDSIWAGVIQ